MECTELTCLVSETIEYNYHNSQIIAFWDNRDSMLARGLSRACSVTAPRAFATSVAPAASRPHTRDLDPELEEILMQPTLDEHALSKYVRNMTPEVFRPAVLAVLLSLLFLFRSS